jgi:hypothetical protein
MSFASTLATPASAVAKAIPVLRGSTLLMMSRTVGTVIGAGLLATVYQLTHEETRAMLNGWRDRRRYRAARHEALLVRVMGRSLSYPLQERFLASSDAFKTSIELLADPATEQPDRDCIRAALTEVVGHHCVDQPTTRV